MLIQFSQIDAPTHIHTNFRFYNISVTMRYIYEVPFDEPYLVTNKEYTTTYRTYICLNGYARSKQCER